MLDQPSRQDNPSSSNLPATPPPIRINVDAIPAALRACPHWFLWRWSVAGDKWTKVPVELGRHPVTGRVITGHIRGNDPSNWLPFADVAGAIAVTQQAGRPFLGAAFRFAESDPFAFVDLDKCRHRDTGRIDDWALVIIRRFNSYTEASPSGTGIKIFIRGAKPGRRCRAGGSPIELYDTTQFSTVTGQRIDLPGLSIDVEDRQAELAGLYRELFPAEAEQGTVARRAPPVYQGGTPPAAPVERSDAWIIDRLARKRFWHGPNKSEQDLALCIDIAYWVGPNPGRIEQILMASPARRPKWRRPDYLARTIDRAIEFRLAKGFYADYLAARQAEIEAIGPASPEMIAALLPQRDKPPPIPIESRPAAGLAVDGLIASLAVPPSPDQVREDQVLAEAARRAARTAHSDRPPPCTCGYKRSMYNPTTGKFRACHVLCGRWRCSTCAPKKKLIWQQHLREVITTVPVPGRPNDRRPRTDPLYVVNVRDDPQTTSRILRRIQRGGGDYARIKYSPGRQIVVSTVSLGARDEPNPLTPTEAADQVVAAIRDMLIFGDSRKPIFTCRAWKLPPRQPAGWTVSGDFPAGTRKDAIVEAMRAELDTESTAVPDVRVANPGLPFMPWVADCVLPRPSDDDPAGELSRLDQARAFHARVVNRLLGLPADLDADGLSAASIDQLFGVQAGP